MTTDYNYCVLWLPELDLRISIFDLVQLVSSFGVNLVITDSFGWLQRRFGCGDLATRVARDNGTVTWTR